MSRNVRYACSYRSIHTFISNVTSTHFVRHESEYVVFYTTNRNVFSNSCIRSKIKTQSYLALRQVFKINRIYETLRINGILLNKIVNSSFIQAVGSNHLFMNTYLKQKLIKQDQLALKGHYKCLKKVQTIGRLNYYAYLCNIRCTTPRQVLLYPTTMTSDRHWLEATL